MKNQSRRDFLKTSGLITAGAVGLSAKKAKATPMNILSDERMGVLVDTTVCIGCRQCELACQKEHDMPTAPEESYADRSVLEHMRRPDTHSLTVINQYENPKNAMVPIDVKFQCMHCDHPGCVSACIVGAFSKHENGAVTWDTSRCIGCRYCMVACPFQVPAFEYDKAIEPRIMKCDLCYDTRTSKGREPACVEACPQQALIFGKRYELLKLAHEKIEANPERYIDHVFGEKEMGGTGWLYLANQDFTKIGFPKLGTDPAPGATEPIQHALFKFFIPPVALYSLLGGIMWLGKNNEEEEEE